MRRSLHPVTVLLLTLLVIIPITLRLEAAYAQSTPTPAITSTATQTNTPLNRQPPTATLRVTGAPFIAGTGVEPAFPAVVMVQVMLDVPLERVRSARVHIYQAESGLDVTAEVDPTDPDLAQVKEKLSVISYPWRIDPATAPTLFSYVNFDWTVSLRENVTANVLSGFIFQDIRPLAGDKGILAWRNIGSEADGLQLYSHNPSLSIGVLQTNASRVLDKLRQQTGLDLRYKFIIYDPGYKFCDGITGPDDLLYIQVRSTAGFYPCLIDNAIAIYHAQGYQVVERANSSLEQLQNQIADLMIREAYERFWRASDPPAWFREGLFQLYQPSGQVRALQIARDASRTNSLLPLAALDVNPVDLSSIELWRSQSYLMIAFMASRYGADAPFTLAAEISDVYAFKAALSTLGTDEQQFYSDWQRWLFTEDADAAVNWTPYLALTATRTNTPAPTLTRSPTSSIPTITKTPSPVPTNPPLVTFTDIPPTETNTARPPGSLRSPTPRPTPTPEGPLITLTRSPLLLIGVVAFVVVVVALVLGFVLRRRR